MFTLAALVNKHNSFIKKGANTYSIMIDYSIPRKVVFTMFDYLENVIVDANEDLKNIRLYYPRNDSLMKIDYNSPSLPTKNDELFHCHVARLLFSSKRASQDILIYVALLCTRVKVPTKQDHKKLGRVVSYLKETVHLPLVIGTDNRETLTWNIDASFAVHLDYKCHTRACLTLGTGSILSISTKQKINKKAQLKLNWLMLMML